MTEAQNDTALGLPPSVRYAGFHMRAFASLIDTIVLAVPITFMLSLAMSFFAVDAAEMEALRHLPPAKSMGELHQQMQGLMVQNGYWKQWLGQNILSLVALGAAIIPLWRKYAATPGKMLLGLKIVDARTGAKPTRRQDIIRYLGYIVSTIPLMLGFFWVYWDKRRQGWHDKMAGTVVVYAGTLSHQPEDLPDPDAA